MSIYASVGEIMIMARPPADFGDFMLCDGRLLKPADRPALFAVIGTSFGGDGKTGFRLPDFTGRTAIGAGAGQAAAVALGEAGGERTVTLTAANLPSHAHTWRATSRAANDSAFGGNLFGTAAGGVAIYGAGVALVALDAETITATGGGRAHDNMQPSVAIPHFIRAFDSGSDPGEPVSGPGGDADFAHYVGEICAFAFSFVPSGFLPCDGRTVSLADFPGLAGLFPAPFGAEAGPAPKGQVRLPDLRGRLAIGTTADGKGGSDFGASTGSAAVALTIDQMPAHGHAARASTAPATSAEVASGMVPAATSGAVVGFIDRARGGTPSEAKAHSASLDTVGAGSPHDNVMPTLGLTVAICVAGYAAPKAPAAGGGPTDPGDGPSAIIGAVKLFAYAENGPGWLACDGRTLPIKGNEALYSLVSNDFGDGDPRASFQLPDLRGSAIAAPDYDLPGSVLGLIYGQSVGSATGWLMSENLPAHGHDVRRTLAGSIANKVAVPSGTTMIGRYETFAGAVATGVSVFAKGITDPAALDRAFAPAAIGASGGDQPHENRQPYLGVEARLAVLGIYPTRD